MMFQQFPLDVQTDKNSWMKRLEWKTMLAGQTALLTVQRRSAKHCAAYSCSG